jgi:ubiquinone/menaquinone biosynthesis C-methylase UbiE
VTVEPTHTPPLGLARLTPLYDCALRLFTRESVWRRRLIERLDAQPDEVVLDVGSGTGTLAVAVSRSEPSCVYRGIDPDRAAVVTARSKAVDSGSDATFEVGFLPDVPANVRQRVDKIVCSLVLHQVPLAEKRRMLAAMAAWLKPGGLLLVADYGVQRGVMRLAFRLTVQLLDGVKDTQPNADGAIPKLMAEAGLEAARLDAFVTPSGAIEIWSASHLRRLRSKAT